jgi:hypothetical protein
MQVPHKDNAEMDQLLHMDWLSDSIGSYNHRTVFTRFRLKATTSAYMHFYFGPGMKMLFQTWNPIYQANTAKVWFITGTSS